LYYNPRDLGFESKGFVQKHLVPPITGAVYYILNQVADQITGDEGDEDHVTGEQDEDMDQQEPDKQHQSGTSDSSASSSSDEENETGR
jgi:hypothetical protein